MLVGLCHNDANWPSLLDDLGYEVRLIGQEIGVGRTGRIAPDLVAYSGDLSHAIVAECKSGHAASPCPDGAYARLAVPDLEPHVGGRDSGLAAHASCRVVIGDDHPAPKPEAGLPLVIFGADSVRGHGSFGNAALDKALHAGSPLGGCLEPGGYYPFSADDDSRSLVSHVLQGILSCIRKPGSAFDLDHPDAASQVLEAVHPYHAKMAPGRKDALVQRMQEIISQLADQRFKEQVQTLRDPDASPAAVRRFALLCDRIVGRYRNQRRIGDRWDNAGPRA